MKKVVCLLLAALISFMAGEASAEQPAISLGNGLNLFVDRHLIDRFERAAELRLHKPVRREVVIVHDGLLDLVVDLDEVRFVRIALQELDNLK